MMHYNKPLFCFAHALLRRQRIRAVSSFLQSPSCRAVNLTPNNNTWGHPMVFRRHMHNQSHDPSYEEDDADMENQHLEFVPRTPSLSPEDAKAKQEIDGRFRTPEEWAEIEENKLIEDKVKTWIKDVVIGLNLCPFAERPLRERKLRIFTVRGNDDEKLLSSILVVLYLHMGASGTSVVVCPECYPDNFEEYLDVLNMLESGVMPDKDMDGVLQIAPFHPKFQFEGSAPDSPDNWTNRSPYPIFHILREDEVARAADIMDGDASRVWKRNVGLLEALNEALGPEGMERIFTSKATPEERSLVDEILQQHKLVLKPPKEG